MALLGISRFLRTILFLKTVIPHVLEDFGQFTRRRLFNRC